MAVNIQRIANVELIRGAADEPETRLDQRNRRVMISTTVILAVLPSARGIPGLPVAQRRVLSPQSTRAGVRPIARMPIGVPTATPVVKSSAPPQTYLRSGRLTLGSQLCPHTDSPRAAIRIEIHRVGGVAVATRSDRRIAIEDVVERAKYLQRAIPLVEERQRIVQRKIEIRRGRNGVVVDGVRLG